MPREIRRKTLCAWCSSAMRCETREITAQPVCSCFKFKGRHPGAEYLFPQPEGIAIVEGYPLWSPQPKSNE